MPSPLVSLPCGSRSMMRVGMPERARYAPRLMTVVVLPTPPFWFVQAVTRTTNAPLRVRMGLAQFYQFRCLPAAYRTLTRALSTVVLCRRQAVAAPEFSTPRASVAADVSRETVGAPTHR